MADASRAIEISPNDVWGYRIRAPVNLHKRDFDCAIADYTRITEIDPNNTLAKKARAKAYGERWRLYSR
jgi:hypothetical protein